MRDALAELSQMRKRGQRPEGPLVVTHSAYVARYYREPNRGMFVAHLGSTRLWPALTGLDVFLIDWEGEERHVEVAQCIVAAAPRMFATSRWRQSGHGVAHTSIVMAAA